MFRVGLELMMMVEVTCNYNVQVVGLMMLLEVNYNVFRVVGLELMMMMMLEMNSHE